MKIPSLVDLTCAQLTELVTEYMQSELSAEDRTHFEQHLHACTWCMTYLAQMRVSVDWLGQLTAPLPETTQAAMLELFRRWQRKET